MTVLHSPRLSPADEIDLSVVCPGSHAQALLARLTRAVARLVFEVPELPGAVFTRAAEMLQMGCDALEMVEADICRADADRAPAVTDDAPSQPTGHATDQAMAHPALEEWLASGADTVTGEPDRRCVPVADLLTLDEVFVRCAGEQVRIVVVGDSGPDVAVTSICTWADELVDRLVEAIMLIKFEARGWMPQTRAQAIALMRDASRQLAERCER